MQLPRSFSPSAANEIRPKKRADIIFLSSIFHAKLTFAYFEQLIIKQQNVQTTTNAISPTQYLSNPFLYKYMLS